MTTTRPHDCDAVGARVLCLVAGPPVPRHPQPKVPLFADTYHTGHGAGSVVVRIEHGPVGPATHSLTVEPTGTTTTTAGTVRVCRTAAARCRPGIGALFFDGSWLLEGDEASPSASRVVRAVLTGHPGAVCVWSSIRVEPVAECGPAVESRWALDPAALPAAMLFDADAPLRFIGRRLLGPAVVGDVCA